MNPTSRPVTPEKILQLTGGVQATALVGTAVTHGVFDILERGPSTAGELAKSANISARGAQALLDGLLALDLISLHGGRYSNGPEASAFLLDDKPGSLTGIAKVALQSITEWSRYSEAVATGVPVAAESLETKDLAFWSLLVPAIAPMAVPAVQAVLKHLDIAKRGPLSILDVGGGSGIFSAMLLGTNPQAQSTQVDWPTINQVARGFVARAGVETRFRCIDGDFHTTDWGTSYDIAIFSNIAHQESPRQNVEAFRRFREAVKPTGTLVVSDFVVRDDRSGSPHALLFHSRMLLATQEGATWREADYRAWLAEAGWKRVVVEPTQGASTLIYATAE